jgi:phosphatidylserine decarboxylase precursor-related protein
MSRVPYIIAQEGWKSIFIALATTVVLGMVGLCFLAFFSSIAVIVLLIAYRDPERVINSDDSALLSICDGKVYHIETLADYTLVSIDSGILDTALIRSPIESTIDNVSKINGINLPTSNIKSKLLNDRLSFDIKGTFDIKVELIAGILANGITFFNKRDNIKRGDRVALMRDGVVKLYLPKDVRLKVDIGDKLRAGESIIGFLNK